MDDKPAKSRSQKRPPSNGETKQGMPPRFVNDARAQLGKLNPGYRLVLEDSDSRATILEGDKVIAGPFTHSGSLLSWLDGYRVAQYIAEKNAKASKKDDNDLPAIHIITAGAGHTFFAYFLVNNKWERVEAAGNPAMSFGAAVELAAVHHRLAAFKVSFEDRTNETLAKEAQAQNA